MRSTQNVPSSTTGTAITGISVARQLWRNTNITTTTSAIASISVLTTSMIESRMNFVVSNGYDTAQPDGIERSSCDTAALTLSATAIALAPGASCTASPDAGWPLSRTVVSYDSLPSSTRATSP